MENIIYHLISLQEWESVQNQKEYSPHSLKAEGFIHLSTKDELLKSADQFFSGHQSLVVLEVHIDHDPHLKWDYVESRKADFPHYYAPLPLSRVANTFEIHRNPAGSFQF